jgi:hypothetical protein
MEKMITELKQLISFKDTTSIGDIVLICIKKPQLLSYALVTGITRDNSRKDEWWQVDMQLLTVPPQPVTWVLRTPQLTGQEIFTMGGEEHFVKAVLFQNHTEESPIDEDKPKVEKKENIKMIRRVK